MQAQVLQQQQAIDQLRRQLDDVQRQQRRQAAPFRRRKPVANPKRPGRPAGHLPAHRPPPTPDQIDTTLAAPLPACPHCHGPLDDRTVHVQYQTDIPPVQPLITQFNIEAGYCPHCQCHVQGRHPEQTSDAVGAAANQLGPRVLAFAADLKHRLGVPYRKIITILDEYFGLSACHAALVRGCERLARLGFPTFISLIGDLRDSRVVHTDDTGWRIGGHNAWLWVFSGAPGTVYLVTPSHGHEVPAVILGPDFQGYMVCDGAKAFDPLEYLKSRCLGHILRRCADLRETLSAREAADVQCLQALLREAIDLGQRRDALTAAGYARRRQEMENRLDDWLHAPRRQVSPELDRLITHLCAHRGEWFVFLEEPDVPPTNNHAEQMLRPAVISRKIGGCNKTESGAVTHSILSSILVTAQRLGQCFVSWVTQCLRGATLQPQPP
ncbi:MAG TPA: IS66 family transposase [Gemmataceae bacterium]|nr:IS66 family transposase [Gemmataceae bacterium]